MATIIISGSSLDVAGSAAVADALRRVDHEIAFDTDATRSEDCRVLLWSQNAARSPSFQARLARAIRAWSEGRLVIVALDESPLPAGLGDLGAIGPGLSPASLARVKAEVERIAANGGAAAQAGLAEAGLQDGWVHYGARPQSPAQTQVRPRIKQGMAHRAEAVERSWPVRSIIIAAASLLLIGGTFVAMWQFVQSEVIWLNAGDETLRKVAAARDQTADNQKRADAARRDVEAKLDRQREGEKRGDAIGTGAYVLFLGLAVMNACFLYLLLRPNRTAPIPRGPLHPVMTPPSAGPHHVFISYSRRDAPFVDRLVREIERVGYRVWIDREAAAAGTRYAAGIVQAIRSAKVVVLMCSHNAFRSDHVMREVYLAGDYRRPIVSIQLDDAHTPDDVMYFTTGFPRLPARQAEPRSLQAVLSSFVMEV